MKRQSIVLLFALVLVSSYSFSQNKIKVGLSGSVQGEHLGILVPLWLSEKIVIAPAVEIKYAETVGTDIGFGISPRYYINNKKVSPYLGLKAGVFVNMPPAESSLSNEKTLDYLFGAAFGGEYFVLENLSFGIEIQGNMTKSDENSYRFRNPDGLTFNTGTMISATIYFE